MKVNGFIEIDETSEEFTKIKEKIRKELVDDLKSELENSEIVDILTSYESGSGGITSLCEILKTVTTNITGNNKLDDYCWDYGKTAFKKLLAIKNILDI